MNQHHDNIYKEVFSNPIFVQQLFEGFMPEELHTQLDFSTLKIHSGNYVTPALKEQRQDVVWSVILRSSEKNIPLYLYILLEFQSSTDATMPLRLLSYVASFYHELIKREKFNLRRDKLPPVLPLVLYSGKRSWKTPLNINQLIHTVPRFLRSYQPELSYFLIDEQRLAQEALQQKPEPLSEMLALNRSRNAEEFMAIWQLLQQKAKAHPEFQHIEKTLIRWLAYCLHLRGSPTNLEAIDTLEEATTMFTFAEELERLKRVYAQEAAQKAQMETQQAYLLDKQKSEQRIVRRMLSRGMSRADIADLLEMTEAEVSQYASAGE